MNEIRAVIVDDEPLARRGMVQLLAAHRDIVITAKCRNGVEALQVIENTAPDLVFLDVQMPEMDGLQVVRERGATNMPDLIFVTAYDEFALSAFELHALDYLLKPVSPARLGDALDRVRERRRLRSVEETAVRLAALVETYDRGNLKKANPARITVPTRQGELILDLTDIDWIEAVDYYAAIHANGKVHLIRESLTSLESRFDASTFIRVSRSAIVRLDRVSKTRWLAKGAHTLVLRDGTEIEVSRRKRSAVAESLRLHTS